MPVPLEPRPKQPQLVWLDRPVYSCDDCGCHLALRDELVSRSFSGSAGPAFLFRSAVNVKYAESELKVLLTGKHIISNLSCLGCDAPLGWVYIKAYDQSQKYKEGKYIIEKKAIMKENQWHEPMPSVGTQRECWSLSRACDTSCRCGGHQKA